MTTLYDILGCTPQSTPSQILAEYRVRVLDTHPDKKSFIKSKENDIEFCELTKAKDILTTPALKQHYDLYLQMGSNLNMSLDEWMNNRDKLQQVN